MSLSIDWDIGKCRCGECRGAIFCFFRKNVDDKEEKTNRNKRRDKKTWKKLQGLPVNHRYLSIYLKHRQHIKIHWLMACIARDVCLDSTVGWHCKITLGRASACSGHITELEQSTFLRYFWAKSLIKVGNLSVCEQRRGSSKIFIHTLWCRNSMRLKFHTFELIKFTLLNVGFLPLKSNKQSHFLQAENNNVEDETHQNSLKYMRNVKIYIVIII